MKKILSLFFIVSFFHLFAQDQVSLISWNIRDFGKTKTATTISKIATIVKDHDIVLIQEVVSGYGGAQAVAKLADELNRKGAKWDYVISNPTKSPPYKTERYAYLWKTSKIRSRGRGTLLSSLQQHVYREPFVMIFVKNNNEFKILNYHSRKHDDKPEEEIADLIAYIQKQEGSIIFAGDFNTTQHHQVFSQLYQGNFTAAIEHQKTTLKQKCKKGVYRNYAIDNVFLSEDITIKKGRVIDFVKGCSNLEEARKISDHLPISVFFVLN